MRGKREPASIRFWRFVQKGPECWQWTGGTSGKDRRAAFDGRRAARVLWEMLHGSIPEGMWVCHHCDNPGCVRPDHLFLGTRADNMRDAYAKGRTALQREGALPRGSTHHMAKLTEQDVVEIRARLAAGARQHELAQEKGVSKATISCIKRGVYWKHAA